MSTNWDKSKYFDKSEFVCSHTGKAEMDGEFITKLNRLRHLYGKPLTISSGYRDATHPVEAIKKSPGAHTSGQACDILIDRENAYNLLKIAFTLEFTGIGVNQKGGARFLHLDTIERSSNRPRPTIWSY